MVRDAFLGLVWAESAPKFWGSLERKQYFFMNKFPEGGGQLVFIILLFFLTKKQKKILKSLGGGRGGYCPFGQTAAVVFNYLPA